jgi:hypothetical protein
VYIVVQDSWTSRIAYVPIGALTAKKLRKMDSTGNYRTKGVHKFPLCMLRSPRAENSYDLRVLALY